MKRIFALCASLLLSFAVAHADDYAAFGLKGKVKSASIEDVTVTFDENGKVTCGVAFQHNCVFDVENISRTASSFVGYNDGDKITLPVKNGRITGFSWNKNGKNYSITYTYNSDGFVSKVVENWSWTEEVPVYHQGSASVNTGNYESYLKKAADAAARGDVAGYQKYSKLAQQAAQNASVNVTQSKVTYKKERKTLSYTATYTYTEKDRFGNWTKRIRKHEGSEHTETQEIQYQPEFVCKYVWEHDVLPTGNLDEIEKFYNDASTTNTYKEIAKTAWNERVMDKVGNSVDKMLIACGKEIMNDANQQKCLDAIRENIYNNRVLRENDYAKLRELANLRNARGNIFDETYRAKIIQRSESLRQDSIRKLTEQTRHELDCKEYAAADRTAIGLQIVDPGNREAAQMRAQAEYALLQLKVAGNVVREEDYKDFIDNNPNSEYDQQVKNARAMLALSRLDKTSGTAAFNRVEQLPTFGETRTIVNQRLASLRSAYRKWDKRETFRANRGGFFHAGLAANIGAGKGAFDFGGGIGMRFGWNISFVNLYVGAEMQKVSYITMHTDEEGHVDDKLENGGYLSAARLNIPVALRLNLWRDRDDYDKDAYLSLGAVYNIPVIGKYCIDETGNGDATWYKDKDIVNSGTIAPRVGLGFCTNHIDVELFGIMEPSKGIYDEGYIVNKDLMKDMNPDIVRKQFDGRFRIGLSFRYLFGK